MSCTDLALIPVSYEFMWEIEMQHSVVYQLLTYLGLLVGFSFRKTDKYYIVMFIDHSNRYIWSGIDYYDCAGIAERKKEEEESPYPSVLNSMHKESLSVISCYKN